MNGQQRHNASMNGQQSQKVSMNGQQSQKVSMNGLPYNNNKNYYKYKSHNSSHKNICTKYATSHFLNVPGSKQN
jgi:hypothetical protein